MSEQADRITRARELGLPTNLEEATGNSGEMQKRAPCFSQTAISKDSSESADERLPFSPEEAVERLREVLRMLESITDHNAMSSQSPLPKARVFLRGIIGIGIAAQSSDAIKFSALRDVLTRLRSKNRNPNRRWYLGWNAALDCLINDIDARTKPITQTGVSASAFSTTTTDHGPASSPETRLKAEEVILREAILDVIDGGCNCDSEKHPWEFYEDPTSDSDDPFTEDMANQQRLRFADAVIARTRRIKKVDEAEQLVKRRINDPD